MDNNRMEKIMIKYLDNLKWSDKFKYNDYIDLFMTTDDSLPPKFIIARNHSYQKYDGAMVVKLYIGRDFFHRLRELFDVNYDIIINVLNRWFKSHYGDNFDKILIGNYFNERK